jgi:hypothetical protein
MEIHGPYALVSVCGRPYRHRLSAGRESLPPSAVLFSPAEETEGPPVYRADGTLDSRFDSCPVWQDEVREMNAYEAEQLTRVLDMLGHSPEDTNQDALPGLAQARADTQTVAFPTSRAYVLQFHARADLRHWQWLGRIEHVRSFASARFTTLDELLDFLIKAMNEHG